MKKIDRLTVRYRGIDVGELSLSPDGRLCVFEYCPAWLADGFSISPLELPLKAGVFEAKPRPFNGAFGVFEDSLPDGYGRYLLHKTLLRQGIDDSKLTVIDRLALVGEGGMGALTYMPEHHLPAEEEISDFDILQKKALEVLRESQDADAALLLYNSGNSGGARPKAVFSDAEGHWIVKFRHLYDPLDSGVREYEYNDMARRCGIDVPDYKLIKNRYFATRRFDIDDQGNRRHVATAGGLLGLSRSEPVLDYSNLLALTGFLTRNPQDVEQMYRRMIFNYLMDNKDDHCKNFSFMVDGERWRLAPAYDLTLSTDGYNGQHATSVNGKGFPDYKDFEAVGVKIGMEASRCRQVYEEMRQLLKI